MVAAKMISSATTTFFNKVHGRASQVDRLLEENQYERCQRLKNMEMAFKVKKHGNGIQRLKMSDEEEKKRLVREMREIRHLTVSATKEMSAFLDATENDCMENTFSVAQHRTFADDCITQW